MFLLISIFIGMMHLMSWAFNADAYPQDLRCSSSLGVGSSIMGSSAKLDSSRSIIVTRNGAVLQSGSQYVAGETLLVSLSNGAGVQQIFQTQNGIFTTNGRCSNVRTLSNNANLQMPASGTVTILAGWAAAYGTVSISSTFSLVPASVPGQPTFLPTGNLKGVRNITAPVASTHAISYTETTRLKILICLIVGGGIAICIVLFFSKKLFDVRILSSLLLAIVCIALMLSWATKNATSASSASFNGFLGIPSWSRNLLPAHPLLMTAGFFAAQIFAIASWSIFTERIYGKCVHVLSQCIALSTLIAGLCAIISYKKATKLPSLTTIHSWLGVACVALYCATFCFGVYMASLGGRWPACVSDYDFDLRSVHQSLGVISLGLTVCCILTGIMDQLGSGGCSYINSSNSVASSQGVYANPAAHYAQLPDACKIANGLGIAVVAASIAAVLMIKHRAKAWTRVAATEPVGPAS